MTPRADPTTAEQDPGYTPTFELLEADIADFYVKCRGETESMGLLFSEIAGQPIPHFIACRILDINEDTRYASLSQNISVKPTVAQLKCAIKSVIDPEDGVVDFRPAIQGHSGRLEVVNQMMNKLAEPLLLESSTLSQDHRRSNSGH